MALTNNFLPQTSLVFGVRDFANQIGQQGAADTNALQNAFKFTTQFADWAKNQKIADELRKEDPDLKEIDALAASRINSPDTTASMWRWKKTMDAQEAQRKADAAKAEAEKQAQADKLVQNLKYKIDAQMKPMELGLETSPEQIQQYMNTLADLEEQGLAGNVGEEYMNKIWNKQAELKGNDTPNNKLVNLISDFDIIDSQFDKVKEQGGYAKNIDAYKKAVDEKYDEIKTLYETYGLPVPAKITQKYKETLNAHNKVKKDAPTFRRK